MFVRETHCLTITMVAYVNAHLSGSGFVAVHPDLIQLAKCDHQWRVDLAGRTRFCHSVIIFDKTRLIENMSADGSEICCWQGFCISTGFGSTSKLKQLVMIKSKKKKKKKEIFWGNASKAATSLHILLTVQTWKWKGRISKCSYRWHS